MSVAWARARAILARWRMVGRASMSMHQMQSQRRPTEYRFGYRRSHAPQVQVRMALV